MPEIKASEALQHHQNLIYRRCLEKLQADQPLNDEELAEVTRRDAVEQKKKERLQRAEKRASRGRPMKLTRDLIKRISAIISEGNDLQDACLAVGISNKTLCRWRVKDTEDPLYSELCEAVDEAIGKAALWHMAQIKKAAGNGAWQASMEWLGRRRSETWARKENVRVKAEHTGPNGTPLPQTNVAVIYIPDNGYKLPDAIETTDEPKQIVNGNGHLNGNGLNGH